MAEDVAVAAADSAPVAAPNGGQKPKAGTHVLVCGDIFDTGGTHWQRAMGLGPFINVDPPRNTVFFAGTVRDTETPADEVEVYFKFDNSVCNVKLDQIKRTIAELPSEVFWVYRAGRPPKLHRTVCVLWEGENVNRPMRFPRATSSVAPRKRQLGGVRTVMRPRQRARRSNRRQNQTNNRRAAAPAAQVAPAAAPVADVPFVQEELASDADDSDFLPDLVDVTDSSSDESESDSDSDTDDEFVPDQLPANDGSDEDEIVSADSDNDASSFDIDDGEEVASDHEEEEYRWTPPQNWDTLVRKTPELAAFGNAVWTSDPDRTSLPVLHPQPDRPETFHVTPDGPTPFATLLLDALPFEFWQETCDQTKSYARKKGAGAEGRRWDEAWVTISFLLRVVAAVIMRGLCPSTNTQNFFHGEFHKSGDCTYSRTGARDFLGLPLVVYEQLLRYLHLVDSTDRPPKSDDAHDKCFLVRPIISRAQAAFKRWCTPGQHNAVDEGGLPSRHTWLRHRNASKPHKYFIEMLMCCSSRSRFCHTFFINEGATKTLRRQNRAAGQTMFKQYPYHQTEYDASDRDCFDKFGPVTAQMHFFARKLREQDPDDDEYVYQIHCDKRWDSFIGLVECKRKFNVAYTSSVDKKSRYHVCYDLGVVKGKQRSNRGKYRAARTTVNGVTVHAVCWADNKLVGFASTQGGSSEMRDTRRQGRHQVVIKCPDMVVTRGRNFRAVDSNDQIRLSKYRFQLISRKKAWPVVFWGVIELIIINIFLIVRLSPRFLGIHQREFRWKMITDILTVCQQLDEGRGRAAAAVHAPPAGRFESNAGRMHHRVRQQEYVTAHELQRLHGVHRHDPRKPKKKKARARDGGRKNRDGDRVYRNPYWHLSCCVVCWAKKIETPTQWYCRECQLEAAWTYKLRVGESFHCYHPRLCSEACSEIFHSGQVHGLDHHKRKITRTRRSRRVADQNNDNSTPRPVRRTLVTSSQVNFSV